MKLDKYQKKLEKDIITNKKGNLILVDAIAGSGKTMIIIRSIVFLIRKAILLKEVPPRILVIVPTNDLVADIEHKLYTKIGNTISVSVVTTFRAFGLSLNNQMQPYRNRNKDIYTNYEYVFFDEVSMVKETIFKYATPTIHGAKVCMVGDKDQLLAVGEDFSYIYNTVKCTHKLPNTYRSNDKKYRKFVQYLKNNVNSKKPINLKKHNLKGFLFLKQSIDKELIDYLDNTNHTAITFTNGTAKKLLLKSKNSITVHKAQGQTFNECVVFALPNDPIWSLDVEFRNRFFYVALSRPVDKITLVV